jgi:hypothetical protein
MTATTQTRSSLGRRARLLLVALLAALGVTSAVTTPPAQAAAT